MAEIPKTMKACAAFGPGDIRLVELPVPEPDDYEVLVKNEGCLFCNSTDRMIIDDLFAAPGYPLVFGHESFGKVVKVGKKVSKFKLGDRVICTSGIKGCDGKYHSVWSGFAEYGIAPMIRKMTKQSGFSLKEIYDLFPSGPAKGACKVAGLPKPTGCV